ncbi:MAG TPA: hypothetical protein VEB40_08695 [Flavipsychrobacter sp.]|nr:hypothetical protein [Flavipsychrobacter sp.]
MYGNLNYNGLDSLKQATSCPGSVQLLFFTPVGNVTTFSTFNNTNGYVTQPVSATWYYAFVPPTNGGYREEQKEGEGGPYFDVQVNAMIPFDSAANQLSLERMAYERFVCMVQLANGVIKVLGDKENPVRFTQSQDTGNTVKGIPGTNVAFLWQECTKPPILQPTDLFWLYKLIGQLAPV